MGRTIFSAQVGYDDARPDTALDLKPGDRVYVFAVQVDGSCVLEPATVWSWNTGGDCGYGEVHPDSGRFCNTWTGRGVRLTRDEALAALVHRADEIADGLRARAQAIQQAAESFVDRPANKLARRGDGVYVLERPGHVVAGLTWQPDEDLAEVRRAARQTCALDGRELVDQVDVDE